MVDAYTMVKAGLEGFGSAIAYFSGRGLKEIGGSIIEYSERPVEEKKSFRNGVRRAVKKSSRCIGKGLEVVGDIVSYGVPAFLAFDALANPFGNPFEGDFSNIKFKPSAEPLITYIPTALGTYIGAVKVDKDREERGIPESLPSVTPVTPSNSGRNSSRS